MAPEVKEVPVLVLDCNQDFEENSHIFDQHIAKITEFITQTQNSTPQDQIQTSW